MLKLAKSLLTILAVAAVAVGATGAYFSDAETVAGNNIQSGTFALNCVTTRSAQAIRFLDFVL